MSDSESTSPRRKVRIRKLRVLALLGGVGLLAGISLVFGMMMAIASDLPDIQKPTFRNSELLARDGKTRIGLLTGTESRFYLKSTEIPQVMRHALIAIEDRRFYEHDGVDLRGVGRALVQDVIQRKAVQGGSTITQQFVKNALAAQNERTLFNKLRESALAYHLTRSGEWTKEDVLRAYLNTIYFGNGAYGIEAAARVYFGAAHGCQASPAERCAKQLTVAEAAMLAGIIASPSGYDPVQHPVAGRKRRDLVLDRMLSQRYISRAQYDEARATEPPGGLDVSPPVENTDYPYFTSWIKQQVVEQLGGGQSGARLAFDGGLKVTTTLDLRMQEAAVKAVRQWLPPTTTGPRVAMVVLDNDDAEVRAMVANGGEETKADYAQRAFNLATQGQRQPGSAFKPFVLAEALKAGYSLSSPFTSRKKEFCVIKRGRFCKEAFQVNNYEDAYAGTTTLGRATTFSDNSVYAELGIKVGTKKIAKLARRMGVRSSVSSNYAMTLGGLKQGVTPLDMAHAYNTFANGGKLVYGTLSPGDFSREIKKPVPGPVGLREIEQCSRNACKKRKTLVKNRRAEKQVLDAGVAAQVQNALASVVKFGTARRADLGDEPAYGKTGTTENYGDAWFVGWTKKYTVAVWVGYPDTLKPMKPPTFSFQGEPVAGGTYPAAIWGTFMKAALAIDASRRKKDDKDKGPSGPTGPAPTPGTPSTGATGTTPAPETDTDTDTGDGTGAGGDPGGTSPEQPRQTTPAQPAEPEPEPPAREQPAPDPPAGGTEEGGAAPPPGT
jgi:penicillin-binding protein 1A